MFSKISRHAWQTGIVLLAVFVGLSAGVFIKPSSVEAVAPTFSVLSWKNGQTKLVLEFSQPVHNGSNQPVEVSDFAVAGANAINIASAYHNPGSDRVILTLAGNLNSTNNSFTVACASNAVFNMVMPPATSEACPTSTVGVYTGEQDTTGPAIEFVSMMNSHSVIVGFDEYLDTATAIAGNFTLATSAIGDTETVTNVGFFGEGADLTATGATISYGAGNTVTISSNITDAVGNHATPTTVILLPSLRISEVKLGSTTSTRDEFIEIYNAGGSAFNTGTTASPILFLHIWDGATDTNVPLTFFSNSIPSQGYFLVGSDLYSGTVSLNARYSAAQLISNGSVNISLSAVAGTNVIDRVGWGTSTVKEGTALSDLAAGSSYERKAAINSTAASMISTGTDYLRGNSYDSGNNSTDFVLQATPVPQNNFSSPEFPNSFGYQMLDGDTTPPTVAGSFPDTATISTIPSYLGVASIDFSESMNPTSISTTTVKLYRNSVPDTNLCSTVVYNPANNFSADTTCTITAGSLPLASVPHTLSVTTGATDTAGNHLASAFSISFTPVTGMTFSSTAVPTVVGSFPNSGSGSFPPNADYLNVNFSQGMNSATFTSSNITLRNTTTSTNQTITLFTPQTIVFPNDSVVLDVSGVTFTAGNSYRLTVGTGVQSSGNIGMASAFNVDFTVSFTTDVTGPIVMGHEPATNATGISVGNTTVILTTDDALLNSTVSSTSALLLQGTDVVPASVSYDSALREVIINANNAFLPSTVYTVRLLAGTNPSTITNVSGTALQDTDGTADNKFEFSFTTGSADSTAPRVEFASATQSNVFVTFSEPVVESQAENLSNWTLQSPTSTSVPLSSFAGSTVVYDAVDRTVTLSGFALTAANTFTVIASGINDLSGNVINPSYNSSSGSVMNSAVVGATCGPGGNFVGNMWDNPTNFSNTIYAFVPQPSVMPGNTIASMTTTYSIDLPITEQIRSAANSGKVVLTFPTGFNVAAAAESTTSPANNDANGPGTGIVAVNSVTANTSARTVTVDFSIATRCGNGNTDPCVTGAEEDFLHFDVSGIVNSAIPRGFETSGYTVDIKTMTGSNVLSTQTSMPFFISAAGNYSITVNLSAGSANASTMTVYMGSPSTGMMQATSTAFSSGAATATFTGLSPSSYMIWTEPSVTLDGTDYNGMSMPTPVFVDGNETVALTLTSAASLQAVNVTVSGATGKNVDVFASGPTGFRVMEIESTAATQTVTLRLADGRWTIGVGPHIEANVGSFVAPTAQDYVTSSPVEAVVAAPTVTESSGVANDGTVLFTLTAASNTIPVLVRDTDDLPIGNAMVFANSNVGMFSTFGQTTLSGTATLSVSPGSYRLGAYLFGAPPTSEISVVVNASGNIYVNGSSTPSAQVVIEIALASNAVTGQVTDGTNPINGASVSARCSSSCVGIRDSFSMTDSSGNYTLYLDNGVWSISAYLPGYGPMTSQTVTVSGSDTQDINFSPSGTTYRTISGTVCLKAGGGSSCAGGTPITDASVNVSSGTAYNFTRVDGSGVYSLRVPSGTGYRVSAFSQTYGELPALTGLNASSADLTSRDIVINTPNVITVSVKNAAGTLVAVNNLFVELVNTTTGLRVHGNVGQGSGLTLNVPNGSYRVMAQTPSYNFGASDAQSDNVGTVISVGILTVDGNEAIKLVTPALYTITGKLTDGTNNIANAWVEASNANTHVGAQTDTSGDFSIQAPPGTYQLNAYKQGLVATPYNVTIVAANIAQNLVGSVANRYISGTITAGGVASNNGFVSASRGTGGRVGVPTNTDGTFTLYLDDGVWTVQGMAPGYQPASLSPITISASNTSSTGNTIALTTTMSIANPMMRSVTPSSGGVVEYDDFGVSVTVPANAISTSTSSGTLSVEETNAVADSTSAQVIGNGFELAMTDAGGTSVTNFNDDVTVEQTVAIATLTAEGIDTEAEVEELTISYYDSTGTWISESTTITYLEADGDVINDPADNLSGVSTVRFTTAVDHFTVFSITAPADGLAPAIPTGVSATTTAAPITVSWTAVTTNADTSPITDLVGYEIYRDTSATGTFLTQLNATDILTTSYTDSTSLVGVTYYYKVTAGDTGGLESTKSSAASGVRLLSGGSSGGGGGITVTTAVAINTPTAGSDVVGGKANSISWTTSGTVQTVDIYLSEDNGTTFSLLVSGVQATANSYLWNTADRYAATAKIKIDGRGSNGVVATATTGAFRISGIVAVTSQEGATATVVVVDPVTELYPSRTEVEAGLTDAVAIGNIIQAREFSTIYYVGADGERHPFPDEKVYFSWFTDFSSVKTVSATTLSDIPLGRMVRVRPGTWLIKIQSDPKVYAVEPGGIRRWVKSETVAEELYGANWNTKIIDVSVAFFSGYPEGSAIDDGDAHPKGSVVKSVAGKVSYVSEGGTLREFADVAARVANQLQDKFVLDAVQADLALSAGSAIAAEEDVLYIYQDIGR